MDKYTFAAELAKALAWPLVVCIVLRMFGGELVKLLKEITTLKIGNVELARNIREATVELAAAETPPPAAVPPLVNTPLPSGLQPPTFTTLNKLFITVEPVGAILQSWVSVEQAIKYVIERDQLHVGGLRPSNVTAARTLASMGYIDKSTYLAINSLRNVRNQLAHGEGRPTPELAAEFVANAEMVTSRLLLARPGFYDDFHENRAMRAADDLKD